MNALETQGLTKGFRQLRGYRDLLLYPLRDDTQLAVDTIDLVIGRGELFGILGENGAGKTTLIRMLSTTLIPTAGTALVGGHDVVRDPQAVRRLIGVVSGDERTFYMRLTGRQNLEFFAALYRVPARLAEDRIRSLLGALDIEEYADRRFDAYSTGIRQRFAIARGMLTQPEVLFLDEPTRALDPIAADEVRSLVAEHVVGELGTTVLLATHTLSEAEAICHRIGIIRRGRLFASGTMAELVAGMSLSRVLDITVRGGPEPLTEAFGRVAGLGDVEVRTDVGRSQASVALGHRLESLTDVLSAIVSTGVVIESSTTRQPTLDDVYRAAHAS